MKSVYRILSHYTRATRMPRTLTGLVGMVLVLLVGGAQAHTPQPADATNTRGLLWKIAGKDYAPSYVFGTIHLADPRVTHLPPPVRDAFNASTDLIVEVVPNVASLGRLALAMRLTDGHSLKQTVGAKTYAEVRAAFIKQGMPLDDIDNYKPWAVSLLLSLPNPGTAVPLDMALQARAAEQGLSISGLETMEEQIAVFDGLSLDDQCALLKATLRDQDKAPAQIETLIRAYLARDLRRLQAIIQADEPENRALTRTVMRRLLTDRNRRMVARMQSWLRRGNAFIAVGAAHLPGPEGILKLLQQDGYRISAVH